MLSKSESKIVSPERERGQINLAGARSRDTPTRFTTYYSNTVTSAREHDVKLVRGLKSVGVDVIDTSSGGNWVKQQIPIGPGYQVPFAERVKKEVPDVVVGSVGLITSPQQAEQILQDGQADAVLLARELLRHADFPIYAAQKLGVVVKPANQYERAWTRMMKPRAA
ncbi:hypothetical protein FRC10_006472 [Ceratobasidium sp. 414]|nr:hypothetical protein FRC10_006472 [Ceratobasidium sp. 414]